MDVSVRYIVDDVEAAIEFYRDRLGFDVDMHPAPDFARLSRDGLRLLLNAPGAGGAGRAGGEPQPGGWNRFQLTVDDLHAVVDDLEQAGVTFRGQLVEGQGGNQILVEDPSGNPVELFEPARTGS
jgi:catechol 2,3-dioxygenase-like lactoylglutathione lyase family enzyme